MVVRVAVAVVVRVVAALVIAFCHFGQVVGQTRALLRLVSLSSNRRVRGQLVAGLLLEDADLAAEVCSRRVGDVDGGDGALLAAKGHDPVFEGLLGELGRLSELACQVLGRRPVVRLSF